MGPELFEIDKKENASWEPQSALDILLVLLYTEGPNGKLGEPIEGITRLDKIMFLLSETDEFKDIIKNGYIFEADKFGPFAPELFDDIELLKQEGILEVVSERKAKGKAEIADDESMLKTIDEEDIQDTEFLVKKYKLTEDGMNVANLIYNELSEKQKKRLNSIKKSFQNIDLTDLLHYVYTRYPETIEKSKIKEKVLKKR